MTADYRNSHGKRSRYDDDDDGRTKRRNRGEDRDPFVIDHDDTVYRYLCPVKKIGSVIGRGGEIVKQLRIDTKSKIRIGESAPGCDERIITIYSSSDETNALGDDGNYVCPAQDALFRVHDRVVAEDSRDEDNSEEDQHVIARLLVPSDQIGSILGKGGQIVQNIRSDTGAQIRILKDRNLPSCALSSDELVQISGEVATVKKALYQIATRLHENPSRTQHLLSSAVASVYPSGSFISPAHGAPIMGITSLVSSYGGYKGDIYQPPRNEASAKEFSLRLVCPTDNIGLVIGKGGTLINQLRQETRATIKVDSSKSEGNDCLITISAKEFFEEAYSPTVEAAVRLQPKCSEKIERDSKLVSFTTRLLVPSSRIGCLLGKGGSIITEMRKLTRANIRILSKENLPKVASEDDEMVQISGDVDVAKDALVQVTSRLRANIFDRDGAASAFLPVLPYVPVASDDRLDYDSRDGRDSRDSRDNRDSKRHGRGHAYSASYGSSDLTAADAYGHYATLQGGGSGGAYGAYGGYAPERSANSGHSSASRRRTYDY